MIEIAPSDTTENEMTYEEAILFCSFLEYNDHRDWRLPTHEEWREHNLTGWYIAREHGYVYDMLLKWWVCPVRDI